ncbi:amidohydrolase family protein [Elongatibacter sediminis]|uniref:Amidohydrolase family protein n=1 Tax=Elongatibacter sediminis TaxID=3119006 RepID=A0AAW9RDR2_9GAMM
MAQLTLKNCRLVDVETGKIDERALRIENGVIADTAARPDTADGQVIDMDGAYVLPGLISCHTHLSIVFPFSESDPDEDPAMTAYRSYARGRDALRAGVTTVRTVGELNRADIALRRSIARGWVRGPRILSAGKGVSVTGGHGHGFTEHADGADEFLRHCRTDILHGADHIKIFLTGGIAQQKETFTEAQMIDREIEAAVQVANSKGTYVCAHVGDSSAMARGLKWGVSCFEHAYNLDSDTARAIADADATIVPTLGVTRSTDWMKRNGFEQWTICKAASASGDHLESIRTAVKAGVNLVNGTDIPPGDTDDGAPVAVREMEHCVEAGLDALQALQTATLNASKLIRRPDLGNLRPGSKADLIAVPANPVDDLAPMREIFFVMQGGAVIRDDRS